MNECTPTATREHASGSALAPAGDADALELSRILAERPDLADVPAAVLMNVGVYDTDCAGGCG